MISQKMVGFLQNNSAIRAMFEEGKRLASIYGAENVYDFSLGNPNVPAPKAVNDAIKDILDTEDSLMVHGYMSNVGYEDVRQTIAESINERFGTAFDCNNLIMTVGAASGLNVIFKTLLNPGDEVIAFSPYFVEYNAYVTNYDGVLVEVACKAPEFVPDAEKLAAAITSKTRAVIINNPNNPTGVVYPTEVIKQIAEVLEEKQKEFGTDIYLISDEPYRELVYGDAEVPYLPKYYRNTIVGYSFSKSLSLPGERIGYLVIPSEISDFENVYGAAAIATRILGYVNAPSLMQRAVARAIHEKTDIAYYDRNRQTLYDMLTRLGFDCVKPEGAFYLWMKTPMEDEKEFCAMAKEYNIIIVPGSSFKCRGYVRIAYCVAYETILHSEEGWKKLAEKVLK
ncbi:MAG: pyridoxal phosphate-dependent aminotransferase [Lachnospiraceae bacterium]|nr:pyridoxal phosphate-dependent aminotransferase [Lachnospiraceae bacterium]